MKSEKDEVFVYVKGAPTYSLLRTKGYLGTPIGARGGTPGDQAIRGSGVIRVGNGFRCPDNMTNGGTFTDAMGTTCGVRIVMGAAEGIIDNLTAARRLRAGERVDNPRELGLSAAITQRNAAMMDQIVQLGGTPFKVTPEYAKEHGSYKQGVHRWASAQTTAQAYKETTDVMRRYLADMRSVIRNEGDFPDTPGRGGAVAQQMHPDTAAMIRDMSDDEIISILESEVLRLHQGFDRSLGVSIKPERLQRLLEDGRYKTTHEVKSDHSGPTERGQYEASFGFPPDTPPELRPASGWVTHPDLEAEARRLAERRHGEITQPAWLPETQGRVHVYGDISIRLRPEVADRSGWVYGDSLKEKTPPVSMNETDPQAMLVAMMSGSDVSMPQTMASLLDAHRTGSFAHVNTKDGPMEDERTPNRNYFESLITGGFTVDEILAVDVPWELMTGKTITRDNFYKRPEITSVQSERMIADFFSRERLLAMGVPPEDVEFFVAWLEAQPDLNLASMPDGLLTSQIRQDIENLMAFRYADGIRNGFGAKGVPVNVLTENGGDPMSPAFHGLPDDIDVDQGLSQRIQAGIPEGIAEMKANALKSQSMTDAFRRERSEQEALWQSAVNAGTTDLDFDDWKDENFPDRA